MPAQQALIVRMISLGWLACKLISYKAWIAERLFPVIPAFDFLESIPSLVHLLLLSISVICLCALVIFPNKRGIAIFLLISEIVSCSLDVIRWQPWEYQFLFFLLSFILCKNNRSQFYTCLIIILASTYIFGGLQKLNYGYLHSIWDSLVLHRFLNITVTDRHWLHYAGLIVPVAEIVGGVSLIVSRKKWPYFLVIGIHVAILMIFGPVGLNTNLVIWPWNLVLIALILILKDHYSHDATRFKNLKNFPAATTILFWVLLPTLGLYHLWPDYLSSGMYSGRTTTLRICSKAPLSDAVRQYTVTSKTACHNSIRLQNWALDELKVPLYPDKWYYRRFARQWRGGAGKKDDVFIVKGYRYRSQSLDQ